MMKQAKELLIYLTTKAEDKNLSDYMVEARSRQDLRSLANVLRSRLGLENCIFFPIVKLLDIFSEIFPDTFSYEIVEDDVLPENTHADTDISRGHIRIKESVYNGACEGNGRDRMTIAHEIGHFLTLDILGFKLKRNFSTNKIPPYCDPEWQAKCFAGELLVPAHLVSNLSPDQIASQCGVSKAAAKFQYNHIMREGGKNCA